MNQPSQEPLILDPTSNDSLERYAGMNPPAPDQDVSLRSGEAAPFIKWAGGKRSIIAELIGRLPETFNRYWEPFVGGGALFFGIHDLITEGFLSDSNLDLTIAYNVVKLDPPALIGELERHAKNHNETYYYRIRGQHGLQDPVDVTARFIYLNKTCYNGLYRVNKKGEFNVPMGSYVNPEIVGRENVLLCSGALQKAKIEYREFDAIDPAPGDFVYCDPPYHPVNSTSFTKYTKLAFGEKEQERLRDFALRLHRQGIQVMLSNSDTPLIRHLYQGAIWHMATVQVPRIVNSKPEGRGAVSELIITNYSP